MPIPTYDELLKPLLLIATIREFDLSADEVEKRLPIFMNYLRPPRQS